MLFGENIQQIPKHWLTDRRLTKHLDIFPDLSGGAPPFPNSCGVFYQKTRKMFVNTNIGVWKLFKNILCLFKLSDCHEVIIGITVIMITNVKLIGPIKFSVLRRQTTKPSSIDWIQIEPVPGTSFLKFFCLGLLFEGVNRTEY